MPWLVADNRVLASVEVPATRRGRARGLLGRDGIDGAMWLSPARSVHTFGMRVAIDVAFCDADGRVLRIVAMPPRRVSWPVRRARVAVEAARGAFAHWGVAEGDVLEVRGG